LYMFVIIFIVLKLKARFKLYMIYIVLKKVFQFYYFFINK